MDRQADSARDRLRQAVRRIEFPSEARLLVAVSGGPDSVALLRAVWAEAAERGWHVTVGHVNHGLRGEASHLDQEFVRHLSAMLGIQMLTERADTAEFAREQRLSLEAAARELRYSALRRQAAIVHATWIVTGHTLDDQAETIMLHLLRGSGVAGLGGMQPTAGDIARPFLRVRRETILEALQEDRQGYRLDSSNEDLRHRRNLIRQRVMPVLRDIQPRAVEALGRTAGLLRDEGDLLAREAASCLAACGVGVWVGSVTIPCGAWRTLHLAIRRTAARQVAGNVLGDIRDLSEIHIEAMLARLDGIGTSTELPRGLTVRIDGDHAVVDLSAGSPVTDVSERSDEVEAGSLVRVDLGERTVEIDRLMCVSGPWHAFCDTDRLGSELTVTTRRPGDRLRPIGLGGSKKLQDILVDRKVPARARGGVAVVRAGDQIVWVPGIAQDETAAIDGSTRRVTHLMFRPGNTSGA